MRKSWTFVSAFVAAAWLTASPSSALAKCTWQVFEPTDPGTNAVLQSVSAGSDDDVWAVGISSGSTLSEFQHFDGTTWSLVPASSIPQSAAFFAVSERSATDVWAVGEQPNASLGATAIVAHWDGASWSVVPNPAQNEGSTLFSVVAVGNEVWAAGYAATSSNIHPLIEHFNGRRWFVDHSYNPPGQAVLQAITSTSTGDVWAGGYYSQGALIEKYERRTKRWNQSNSGVGNYIDSMSARSPSDVWAVGPPSLGGLFVERWNGTGWDSVPYPRGGNAVLYAVDAMSSGDTWFVGTVDSGSSITGFVDRYRGHWTDMKVIEQGPQNTELAALTSVPGSPNVWVVGESAPSPSEEHNLAERYTCR